MSSVNKVIVMGRIGADPEIKTVGSGTNVARLSIATTERWSSDGEKKEKTEWHRVVLWGGLADLAGKYLSKGRQVYIEGRLETRSWEDQQGQKRYSTEIVAKEMQFIGGKNEASATDGYPHEESSLDGLPNHAPGADDGIPF